MSNPVENGGNVAGARGHDYLHAVAARKAEANELLTRNQNDFSGLTGEIPLVWPQEL